MGVGPVKLAKPMNVEHDSNRSASALDEVLNPGKDGNRALFSLASLL
jgi:hypothetical protein